MQYDLEHTFVTSDHHFGSFRKVWPPPAFPAEEEVTLVEKWNSAVKDGDTVLYVGDFCDCDTVADMMAYRQKLNGKIVLIKGNHDRLPDAAYEAIFQGVTDRVEIPELNLTLQHCPGDGDAGMRQIYGHLHRGGDNAPQVSRDSFCACVQHNDGRPVLLEDALVAMEDWEADEKAAAGAAAVSDEEAALCGDEMVSADEFFKDAE